MYSMCYDAVLGYVCGYITLSYSAATKCVLQIGMENKLQTVVATADRLDIQTDSKCHVANLVPPTPAKTSKSKPTKTLSSLLSQRCEERDEGTLCYLQLTPRALLPNMLHSLPL